MPIITIDGNIGCGKSSVLNYLHKFHKLPIVLEPVESWEQHLINLYKEKKEVFQFQVRVWLDRCWIQEKSDKSSILMERSPLFIKEVFIKAARLQNLITTEQEKTLYDIHKNTDNLWKENHYIYLCCNPDNCLKKIKKRNRQYESNITQDYINLLHNLHQEVCMNNPNIKVIDVNNRTVVDIANEILEYMKINKFIDSI